MKPQTIHRVSPRLPVVPQVAEWIGRRIVEVAA